MNIQRFRDSQSKYEYGCDLRRIYPWAEVASPLWGTAIASVRPNECTTPHSHNEFETFLVLSGQGRMTIEDETGNANLVVWKDLFEEYRKVIMQARLIMVEGKVQKEGDVIHVIVSACHDFSGLLRGLVAFKVKTFMAGADNEIKFPEARNFK